MNRHSGSVVVACLGCVLLALLGSSGCGSSGSDASAGGTHDAGVIDAESLVPDGGCGARIGVACVVGAPCQKAADCSTEICTTGTCRAVPTTCTDGTKDGTETDTDCGGTSCPPCAVPDHCAANTDCLSGYCDQGTCSPPTPTDRIADDSETDVDCGGAIDSDGNSNPESDGAPACGNGKLCGLASDCLSGVCTGATGAKAGTCAVPTATDGVKNGGETGVDCGGMTNAAGPVATSDGAPACPAGQGCAVAADCTSAVCTTMVCQAADPTDGVKNGGETDTDCGGTGDGAPPCAPGKMCMGASDCDSKVCTANVCVAASATDKVQNGGESDVDCGGTTTDSAPRCADALHCANDGDCLSSFCSLLNGTCVDGRSCKGIVTPAAILDPTTMKDANGDAIGTPDPNGVGESAGIDTCGKGEATDPAAQKQHESCCRSLAVPGSTTWRLDKYEATSGRVRQFLESLNWDVRTWATAQFDKSWSPITTAGTMLAAQLPINQAGVTTNFINLLPNGRDTSVPLNAVIATGALVMDTSGDQGCVMSSPTEQLFSAMTYWWDGPTMMDQASSSPRPFTQDYYDIKPMNCMPYYFAAAFCAWDGGRLQLHTEHAAAWGPTSTSPWTQPNLPNPYPGNQQMYTVPACGSLATNGAVNCTMDWFNGGQAPGSQGDFYYYPSTIAGIPTNLVPDTLSNGLDLTPYISAPGRFYMDVTAIKSSSFGGTEGWRDMGADMIELDAATTFTGGGSFCDASGVTAPGETSNCQNSNASGPVPGVLRASNLPPVDLLGGSWEGHAVAETYSAGGWSVYRQYGKTGIRCARPAEPAK